MVTYARLPEALSIITGHGFRLGVITTALAIVVLLLSGGFFRIFSSKIVLGLFAFTIWMGVSMPFSVWRGGSFSQFIYWILSLICLSLLAGCIDGLEHLRRAMFTMALSVLCIEAMSFFFGSMRADDGRLSFVTGTFANANDLAALLLIGLPFCLLAVRLLSGFSIFRVASFFGLLLIPITVVRTGSRGGLLALVIMFAIYFFSVPVLQKIPLAVGALVLAVAAILFTTHDALERYKTIFVGSDQVYYADGARQSAVLSTLSRKELLMNSIRLTFMHPVLGVGPGMFQVADAQEAAERKQQANWHQTHNTFTQISSEEGLPALFFYVMSLVFCFTTIRRARLYAKAHPEIRYLTEMAFCLRLSLLAFTITAVFASNAYYFYFPMVAGLCAALERYLAAETKAATLPESSKPHFIPVPRPRPQGAVPARFV